MKEKVKKWLALATMVMAFFSAGTMTVFANTDETVQTETPPAETSAPAETETSAQTEAPAQDVLEETEPEGGNAPFSVPGNGQLADDIKNDGTKQFLTVQTKNGNTFFLVIDRSGNTENVYMLSMVDENDLEEFVEDGGQREEKVPQVVIPETDPAPVQTEPEKESEPEQEKGGNMGTFVAIALLAAGAGGLYYMKVVKPKKEEDEIEDENLEMYDGGRYYNEDQEPDMEPDEED